MPEQAPQESEKSKDPKESKEAPESALFGSPSKNLPADGLPLSKDEDDPKKPTEDGSKKKPDEGVSKKKPDEDGSEKGSDEDGSETESDDGEKMDDGEATKQTPVPRRRYGYSIHQCLRTRQQQAEAEGRLHRRAQRKKLPATKPEPVSPPDFTGRQLNTPAATPPEDSKEQKLRKYKRLYQKKADASPENDFESSGDEKPIKKEPGVARHLNMLHQRTTNKFGSAGLATYAYEVVSEDESDEETKKQRKQKQVSEVHTFMTELGPGYRLTRGGARQLGLQADYMRGNYRNHFATRHEQDKQLQEAERKIHRRPPVKREKPSSDESDGQSRDRGKTKGSRRRVSHAPQPETKKPAAKHRRHSTGSEFGHSESHPGNDRGQEKSESAKIVAFKQRIKELEERNEILESNLRDATSRQMSTSPFDMTSQPNQPPSNNYRQRNSGISGPFTQNSFGSAPGNSGIRNSGNNFLPGDNIKKEKLENEDEDLEMKDRGSGKNDRHH